MLIANSPLDAHYTHPLTSKLVVNALGFNLNYSLLSWINNGQMAVFFLLVGLEIKRELIAGELSSFRKAALPILLFSWAAVNLGLGSLPTGVTWNHLIGVGILGGIGFTMSMFIALLSFPNQESISDEGKFAVLTASLLTGLTGYLVLRIVSARSVFSEEKRTDELT